MKIESETRKSICRGCVRVENARDAPWNDIIAIGAIHTEPNELNSIGLQTATKLIQQERATYKLCKSI